MTNFEYYKDVLLNIPRAVALEDGEPRTCEGLPCGDCGFGRANCDYENCHKAFIYWLYEEHIEKPKITPEEHKLCEGLAYGYIARDESGLIYWYLDEPHKEDSEVWLSKSYSHMDLCVHPDAKFDFIKWEDEKAWSVEDLLQLAVK